MLRGFKGQMYKQKNAKRIRSVVIAIKILIDFLTGSTLKIRVTLK